MTRNPGLLVLGIWLILSSLLPFVNPRVENAETLLQVLAAAAGVLIIVAR